MLLGYSTNNNTMTLSRKDAPEFVYVVFDTDGVLVKSFDDESAAYDFADRDQRVVTYSKAPAGN